MNSDKKVFRYAPDIYVENEEMLAVYNSQNIEIEELGSNSLKNFLNNFLKSCDVEGVRRFEKILDILADEILETLEFRKLRVLNRLVQQPPYTKIFLENMLKGIFGEDNVSLKVTENDYIIEVVIHTSIDGLYDDTIQELRKIIPANIVIKALQVEPYMHMYLNKKFTYKQMEQLTQGELSQYAGVEE